MIARIAGAAALTFVALVTGGAVRGQQQELSRAVVLRFLQEKGFVAGHTVQLDRPYLLQSVNVTAHGNGEFTVRFRAR